MGMIYKKGLLAVALLLGAVPGFPQQEQTPKDQAPPDASAPQAQSPQATTPAAEQPQSSAPPAAQEPQPAPNENPPPTSQATPPATKPRSEAHTPAASAKSSPAGKKPTAKKKGKKQAKEESQPVGHPSAPSDPGGQTGKVVVRNGGATDGLIQLSPGGNQEQEIHNRENTAQLLATTDENLKRISGRQLTSSEQSTLDQIQTFMRQARSASDAGDLARAHTLAFKAHLLSDDLAKR